MIARARYASEKRKAQSTFEEQQRKQNWVGAQQQRNRAMTETENDFLVKGAQLIAEQNMTIAEFYQALGFDLEDCRCDASMQIAELAGIFKGWKMSSNHGAE